MVSWSPTVVKYRRVQPRAAVRRVIAECNVGVTIYTLRAYGKVVVPLLH